MFTENGFGVYQPFHVSDLFGHEITFSTPWLLAKNCQGYQTLSLFLSARSSSEPWNHLNLVFQRHIPKTLIFFETYYVFIFHQSWKWFSTRWFPSRVLKPQTNGYGFNNWCLHPQTLKVDSRKWWALEHVSTLFQRWRHFGYLFVKFRPKPWSYLPGGERWVPPGPATFGGRSGTFGAGVVCMVGESGF